jgi:hypothetical protein
MRQAKEVFQRQVHGAVNEAVSEVNKAVNEAMHEVRKSVHEAVHGEPPEEESGGTAG